MRNFLTNIIMIIAFLAICSCHNDKEQAFVILNAESLELPSDGGATTIGVKSNRNWTAQADVDWISLTPSSAEAFEASSYMIITVQPNNDLPRTANVVVSADTGEASAMFTVIQGENMLVIKNAEQLVAAFEALSVEGKQDDYKLGKDIDMGGGSLAYVSKLNATFDGQGHTINNLVVDGSLFGTLSANAAIKNLTLAENCTLTIPGEEGNIGIIVGTSAGTLENITNNADIHFKAVAKGYKGAICGESTGPVISCINRGDITYSGQAHTDGSLYVGGVIGRMNASNVEVKDCINEGDISFIFTEELNQSIYIAGVSGAINNNSKAIGCTNTGNVFTTCKGSKSNAHFAGIVCYAGGEVKDCTNSGDIEYRSETGEGLADGVIKGTGVAGIASYIGWADKTVYNNKNTGNITMVAGYTAGYQTVGSATKFSSNVAGVFAHAFKCNIEDCHNTGIITSIFSKIEQCPAEGYNTTARQSVGGVVSSPWGAVADCSNKGNIVVDWRTSTHDAGLNKNFVGQVGGVVGGDYHSDQVSTVVKNCTNEGNINIICDAAGPNNAFGGISGWPTKENVLGMSVENCVNRGNITVDGYSKARVGGITGGAATHEGNTNYGNVHLKGGVSSCAIGGVAGFMNFLNISSCANYGDVVSDVALTGTQASASGAIGGLVGAVGNTSMKYTNCKVDCSLSAPNLSTYAMVVGSIGHAKTGGRDFTVGTPEAPILIKGTCCGMVLTPSNYTDFITAYNYSNLNPLVVFNVLFLN